MPPYARPADVVFDHDAAQRLLDEIRRTIASVGDDGAAWHRASAAATADWSGSLAASYAIDEQQWRSRLGDAVADLTQLAARVEHGVATAIAEHHRIERLQAEWDAEAEREADAAERGD
ncbi:MAG: hypothetical protein ACE367_09030 [Acidimicrobiales bacterium]